MVHSEKEDAIYFLEKADQLFHLIKHARANSIPHEELCAELECLANEFMAKAVAKQTRRGRGAIEPQL